MRDQRLQELRQRLSQGASLEDEATWIRERLRSGDLDADRLELAIYLGSASARALLEDAPPHAQAPKRGVRTFVKKLKPWGYLACLRATIAATRLLVSERDDRRRSARIRHLHLAEDYALDPSPARAQSLRDLGRTRRDPGSAKWRAAKRCGEIALDGGRGYFEWRAKEGVAWVAEELRSESKVRAAIVAELLPWALGYSDPLALRVSLRRASAD